MFLMAESDTVVRTRQINNKNILSLAKVIWLHGLG
jgi:hypothetical protein